MAAKSNAYRLQFYQSPGDTLVATGALECLHQQHPGRFKTDVGGVDADAIFANNPHVTKLPADANTILMGNPLINHCDHRPCHFLESYCETLARNLGVELRCTVKRPYLYLSDQEKGWTPQVQGKYWVVSASYKSDYTVKHPGHALYQEVVNKLKGDMRFVQVGLKHHNYKPLDGAINLVGKTDTRQLIRLCYHAQGGIGPESFLHHVFAALSKPFVCVASGFLPVSWVSYPTTTILHRQGMLPCCRDRGCWKARTVRLNDGDQKDKSLCMLPVLGGNEPVPRCMALITPDDVIRAIRSYYLGGVLDL